MPASERALTQLSLYQRVLGGSFDELAPALRSFHAQLEGARARGALEVRRGRGPLARLAAWTIRAPAEGPAVPVDLAVEVHGEREHWVRHFAGRPMITRQWRAEGMLVEAISLTQLHFELRVQDGAMRFVQRRCVLLGFVPLPSWLAPRIEVEARGAGPSAWHISVEIHLPVIGLVTSYAGQMEIGVEA